MTPPGPGQDPGAYLGASSSLSWEKIPSVSSPVGVEVLRSDGPECQDTGGGDGHVHWTFKSFPTDQDAYAVREVLGPPKAGVDLARWTSDRRTVSRVTKGKSRSGKGFDQLVPHRPVHVKWASTLLFGGRDQGKQEFSLLCSS